MRWTLVDRIDAFEPWRSIAGQKCVSFEECSLLDGLGREGSFPEALLLECFVELGRWLVMGSSEFRETAWLGGVERFSVDEAVEPGETLCARLRVTARAPGLLEVDAESTCERRRIGRGRLTLEIGRLDSRCQKGDARALWEKLHEPTART